MIEAHIKKLFANTRLDHFRSDVPLDNSDLSLHNTDNFLTKDEFNRAHRAIASWPNYQPTPLIDLDHISDALGLGKIYYKDESQRFHLKSFKALGGAYAVLELLSKEIPKRTQRDFSEQDLITGQYADIVKDITIVTATDGNHGRSVAWGAQMFGCPCFIYMHAAVSPYRIRAIEEFGATVISVDGNYDLSVEQAAKDANDNHWFVVSDTTYEGYLEIPRFIMAGYGVMLREIEEQITEKLLPTHIFVQCGVGGLPAAMCNYQWAFDPKGRPRFINVEANLADCMIKTMRNNKPTVVNIVEETIMAGLSCGKVSDLAYEILKPLAHDYLTINDEIIPPVIRLLADHKITAGESAVAGLSALMACALQDDYRQTLGLNQDSRILILSTEGNTDPEIYEKIINHEI